MVVLALAAAGLLMGPEPDLRRINPGNYPVDMLRANKSVSAEMEFIISPEGEIESCTLISFVGDETFAKRMCSLMDKRTWKKSLDSQGHAVYGQVRTTMKFTIPGTKEGQAAQQAKEPPDLQLSFPESRQSADEIDVPLAVLVGEDGHVEACNFQPTPLTKKAAEELAELACQGVTQKSFAPLNTRQGSIQRYVVIQKVRFSAANR